MTGRERFLKTMRFEPVDRAPMIECGLWGQTYERWQGEGMPEDVHVKGLFLNGNEFFGLDRILWLPLNFGMMPGFEEEIIEETDRYLVKRHTTGAVTRALKEGTVGGTRPSMDQHLDHPVKTRGDFLAIKRRYDPSSPMRYPEWWPDLTRTLANRDYPVGLPHVGAVGFYSGLRQWMGTENACTVFHDDPGLAHEMVEFIADFTLAVVDRALNEVDVDFFMWFEDYAFKTGPLVSPSIFKEFLLGPYRRVNDRLRAAGIEIIAQDTDGNAEVLLPLHLEAGINLYYPIECAAGQDPLRLRQEYGHDLLLWGGIDKRALARDKDAIDSELLRKLPPLLADGGYIPMLDHTVPPDVPYENWLYYLDMKRKLLEGRYGA